MQLISGIRAAGVALTVFINNSPVYSDSMTDVVQIIVAADQSRSMYLNPRHALMQARGFRDFFANLPVTCAKVRVDYISWGTVALPSIRADLASKGAAEEFAAAIFAQAFIDQGGTSHYTGLTEALYQLEPNASQRIIIFTTDEWSMDIDGFDLKVLIPEDVKFYGIAIGTDSTYDYLVNQVSPPGGVVFKVNSAAEIKTSIGIVFDAVARELCIG